MGFSRKGENQVSIQAGRAVFLPPKQWKQILLPFKLTVKGHISVFCGLCKKGIIAGLAIT